MISKEVRLVPPPFSSSRSGWRAGGTRSAARQRPPPPCYYTTTTHCSSTTHVLCIIMMIIAHQKPASASLPRSCSSPLPRASWWCYAACSRQIGAGCGCALTAAALLAACSSFARLPCFFLCLSEAARQQEERSNTAAVQAHQRNPLAGRALPAACVLVVAW